MESSPRADAHIHLFRSGFFDHPLPSGDLETYDHLRRLNEISHALVVGYEGETRFAGNNDDILAISQNHGWAFPLAFLDVARAPHPNELSALRSRGFIGFALYLNETGPSLDEWPAPSLAALVHDDSVISVNGNVAAIKRVSHSLGQLEQGSILVSHLGSPGQEIAHASKDEAARILEPILAMRNLPNVSIKVTGLYAIDPRFPHNGAQSAFETISDSFDPTRLVWGSDFSPALGCIGMEEVMTIPEWLSAGFSTVELTDVLGNNLIRVIELANAGCGQI